MEEAHDTIRSRATTFRFDEDDDEDADTLSISSSTSSSRHTSTRTPRSKPKAMENSSSVIRHSVAAAMRAMALRCRVSALSHPDIHGPTRTPSNGYVASNKGLQEQVTSCNHNHNNNNKNKRRKYTRFVPSRKLGSLAEQTMRTQMVG
ncbi:uncharacterized protein ACLA_059470 [Aspergillus clavatus NRRL 1]|uniref:Uncharacterized protein n=1 Tax=Aspergillus clavatus (strain ATCC 1007 / CBS 513.65 / DSM 816 / NCTC 3887 / NRRL 1 / QM 1276 / 107) TaxID=344612 RepID=A1C4E1_ASPCL|nr:uncharacterized protein ACLA_059470 [Aspergillus clavatus NRRL 1]EAW15281.1 hypothetical protein ACLA_059470 [Aspergillus clavatus NRRL 1]